MCFFLWTEPSSFSSGLLKTGMFILSMMRSQTLHNGLKAQCGLAPTYLSTSLISLLLLTNMCCQTPPRITLAAFWLYTPKHPHLRKFIHAICPCLEHSSQSLQILLALSVRITSRVDFLKHIHPVSPVFYFILSTYGSIWSHHIMTNGRGNNGNSDRLFSWAPKITVDSDCSHKNKRCLLLGRQAMTNLNSMLESRDIPLPTKLCIVKAMVFPIVLYGCENWAKEKTEDQRIYAFKLWCWRRILRVPWIARRSNKSILKEINTSLEGLILRLKLHYFGHLFTGKDSDARKDWGQEEKRATEGELIG